MSRHNLNQRGYTMIELLVVIVITTAIAIPLGQFAISGMKSYSLLEAQSNTSVELNILAGRIAKVVRGATSVVSATPNELKIYGYFSPQDTVTKLIRYTISGNRLTIGVTPPSGPEVTSDVRIDITNGSTPMFTYLDDNNNSLGASPTPGTVKQIGVYLSANPAPKLNPKTISLSTNITLRNLKTNL